MKRAAIFALITSGCGAVIGITDLVPAQDALNTSDAAPDTGAAVVDAALVETGCTVKTTGVRRGTTVNGGSGPKTWTDPDHARVADGSTATFILGFSDPSAPLEVRGFGFQIPEKAQLLGVTVRMVRSGNYDLIIDQSVLLVTDVPVGLDHKASTPWKMPAPTYGGPNDTWNASLTPAIVNAASFGVALTTIFNSPGGYYSPAAKAAVDEISLELTYCE